MRPLVTLRIAIANCEGVTHVTISPAAYGGR